jgi:hypothetical protein
MSTRTASRSWLVFGTERAGEPIWDVRGDEPYLGQPDWVTLAQDEMTTAHGVEWRWGLVGAGDIGGGVVVTDSLAGAVAALAWDHLRVAVRDHGYPDPGPGKFLVLPGDHPLEPWDGRNP